MKKALVYISALSLLGCPSIELVPQAVPEISQSELDKYSKPETKPEKKYEIPEIQALPQEKYEIPEIKPLPPENKEEKEQKEKNEEKVPETKPEDELKPPETKSEPEIKKPETKAPETKPEEKSKPILPNFEGLEYHVIKIKGKWFTDLNSNKKNDILELEYIVRQHGTDDTYWLHPIKKIDITYSNGKNGQIGVSQEEKGVFLIQYKENSTEDPRIIILDFDADGYKSDTDDRFYLPDENGEATQDLEDSPLAKKYTKEAIWGALTGDALKQLKKIYKD